MARAELIDWVQDARRRTEELVADLTDEELMGPQLDIVNPVLWEIGHIAWFQEKWVLRHTAGRPPIRDDADALWDSIAIAHDTRWDLPLPSRQGTLDYVRAVRDRVVECLRDDEPTEALAYFVRYTVFHEDMHTEAFTYTRQTHGHPAPTFSATQAPVAAGGADETGPAAAPDVDGAGPTTGDVDVPGGTFWLGAAPDGSFVFDNEKWAHPVELEPFRIARAPVTQAEFAEFVDDGGYRERRWWSDDGWRWCEDAGAEAPVYWRRTHGAWQRRRFDRWVPLEPHRPMVHVSYHEAEAYCRWAGRRLPTEAEWEAAAAGEPDGTGLALSPRKRRYPWGDEAPTPERVNMDWAAMGTVDVGAHAAGDSAFGCRQMLGNVWEWTSSTFEPFPGFVRDPYAEYSEPWFDTRKVLRGGAWATRSRMLRNTWRNYFTPDRRDTLAGFRTCALDV